MSETLINIENVSKKFCRDFKQSLFYGFKDLCNEICGISAIEKKKLRKNEFWAVDNISFHVKRGDCLALIGRNGAGKSTLLKMLNGLIKPDKGRIQMKGRVGALIELGAGFNPILTGRENIYVNGAVLGFTKTEMNGLFNQIVAFSELEEFIDTPVQYYSTGMKVRLGFSIASQLRPDILLIDEVLAVGDAGFKIKCYNEIYKMMNKTAIVFVTHSMPQVAKICNSAILLENAKVQLASKNVSDVINNYFQLFDGENKRIEGSDRIRVKKVVIQDNNKQKNVLNEAEAAALFLGEKSELSIFLEAEMNIQGAEFLVLFSVEDFEQKVVLQLYSGPYFNNFFVQNFNLDLHYLNSGRYNLSIHLIDFKNKKRNEILWGLRNALQFSVARDTFYGPAPIIIKHSNHEVKNN